jgi:hypothetical protein
MRLFERAAIGAIGIALASSPGHAQTYRDTAGTIVPGMVIVNPVDNSGPMGTTSNPLKVAGAFSASLSGFTPTPAYSALSVGATSSRVALPSGTAVVVYNTGSNDASVTLGNSSVTASAANDMIKAGGWMAFAVGANTYLAAIESTGATSLTLSGGSGLPTGSGGGSGGSASVPTGAAGSPSASVLSVQGVTGGSALSENQTQLGGAALGAATSWGLAPSGNVQGVNANVLALPSLPAGSNMIGSIAPQASAMGGSNFFSEVAPANTTGVSIKASPGTVYSLALSNNGAAPFYVKLYNTATAPTCGSGSPVARFEVPANSTAANGAGSNLPFGQPGIAFSSGIGLCVTAGIADSDATAPPASVGVVNVSYQ